MGVLVDAYHGIAEQTLRITIRCRNNQILLQFLMKAAAAEE